MLKNLALICVVLFGLFAAFPQVACSQTEEVQYAEELGKLQLELDSASISERDAAEEKILALGTDILDYLESPSRDYTSDRNERLKRIRKKLEKVAVQEVVTPTKITISGEVTLKQAFNAIEEQSGNRIALIEGAGEIVGKKIKLELKDASFWEAANEICDKASLQMVSYGGSEPGQQTVMPRVVNPDDIDKASDARPPHGSSGIFSISVNSVSAARNFAHPELNYTQVDLTIFWEPRLEPISIELKKETVAITDEAGKPIEIRDKEGVSSAIVQPGTNHVEMSLTLPGLHRDVKSIGSITAQLDCILPGRREKFRFDKIGELEGEPSISKAGLVVSYMGIEQNEDLYGVNIRVSMEDPNEELESHLEYLYDNPIFLVNDVGQKEDAIGRQGGEYDGTGLVVQYFFAEDPAKMGLLYESPGAIVEVPAKFEIKRIALP